MGLHWEGGAGIAMGAKDAFQGSFRALSWWTACPMNSGHSVTKIPCSPGVSGDFRGWRSEVWGQGNPKAARSTWALRMGSVLRGRPGSCL